MNDASPHPEEIGKLVERLEPIAKAATQGAWFWSLDKSDQVTSLQVSGSGDYVISPQVDVSDYGLSCNTYNDVSEADAAHIAAFDPPTALQLLSALTALVDRAQAAEAECDRLREALTPSADTKAAYHGEFSFQHFDWNPETEEPETVNVLVPWTTIKEIMAAILKEADHG